MPVAVVANPKGGVGKTTLATNLAGYFAARDHAVMLGDTDRQQSSREWLALRPATARPIHTWDISADHIAKPPKGTTHVVLDTPAGLHGWRLADLIRLAGHVIVPLQPSMFDILPPKPSCASWPTRNRFATARPRWAWSACAWTCARGRRSSCSASCRVCRSRSSATCATPRTTCSSPRTA